MDRSEGDHGRRSGQLSWPSSVRFISFTTLTSVCPLRRHVTPLMSMTIMLRQHTEYSARLIDWLSREPRCSPSSFLLFTRSTSFSFSFFSWLVLSRSLQTKPRGRLEVIWANTHTHTCLARRAVVARLRIVLIKVARSEDNERHRGGETTNKPSKHSHERTHVDRNRSVRPSSLSLFCSCVSLLSTHCPTHSNSFKSIHLFNFRQSPQQGQILGQHQNKSFRLWKGLRERERERVQLDKHLLCFTTRFRCTYSVN